MTKPLQEKLRDLHAALIKSGLKAEKVEVDQRSYERLIGECYSDRSLVPGSRGWKWRDIPVEPFRPLIEMGELDFSQERPVKQDSVVAIPFVLTIVAKNRVGRVVYFNDPENAEDYR